jgi:Spy/CpxP family protein refolding chaperone
MHQNQMARMAEQLNLTDDQKTQFKQMHEDMRSQAKAIHDDTSLSAADKKAKMKALHQQSHEKMMGLLTDDQKQKFQAMHKEHKGKGHRHGAKAASPSTNQ